MDGIDQTLNEEFENLIEFYLNYLVDSNEKTEVSVATLA